MIDDDTLTALLAAAERDPDEAFVARVARAVEVERQIAASRRGLWQRFAVETVSSAAIVSTIYLLWRVSPALSLDRMPIAPTIAVILILFLWIGIGMNQPNADRRLA